MFRVEEKCVYFSIPFHQKILIDFRMNVVNTQLKTIKNNIQKCRYFFEVVPTVKLTKNILQICFFK